MSTTENIRDLAEDNQKKTFAVQSLIGQRARLNKLIETVGLLIERNSASRFKDVLLSIQKTKSQFLDEVFALAFAMGKRGGYFVEFGSCDGLHLSNTYMLEKQFGWQGILAEPAHIWHADLERNRTAIIDHRCVSKDTGHYVDFLEVSSNPGTSKVTTIQGEDLTNRSYKVETVSLIDLLGSHNAPQYIDFISMDTEGTESEILSSFDFRKYKFGFISVEKHRSSEDITSLLESAGYEVLFPREVNLAMFSQVSGFNIWYVPKEKKLAAGDKTRPY